MLPNFFNAAGDECWCILIHFRMSYQKLDDRYRTFFLSNISTRLLCENYEGWRELVKKKLKKEE